MKVKPQLLKQTFKFVMIAGALSCLYAGPTLVAWIGWPTERLDQIGVIAILLTVLAMSLAPGLGTGSDGDWFGGSGDGGGDGGGD